MLGNNHAWFIQASADISVDTRHPTLQGLTFPFDENVIEAIHLFKKHQVDYIQLVGISFCDRTSAKTTTSFRKSMMKQNAFYYLILNLMRHQSIFEHVCQVNREDIMYTDLNMTTIINLSIRCVKLLKKQVSPNCQCLPT